MSYSKPFRSFASRDRSFRLNYGFTCECRLCQLDRNDADCGERERLVKMCQKISVFSDVNFDEVLPTLTSLLNQVIVLIWLFRESKNLFAHAPGSLARIFFGGRQIISIYSIYFNQFIYKHYFISVMSWEELFYIKLKTFTLISIIYSKRRRRKFFKCRPFLCIYKAIFLSFFPFQGGGHGRR